MREGVMNKRLQHECAFMMARTLLGVVQACIRPEEQREAFEELFQVCLSSIEEYDIQRERMLHRLRPVRN
jgi:hypothetical protein